MCVCVSVYGREGGGKAKARRTEEEAVAAAESTASGGGKRQRQASLPSETHTLTHRSPDRPLLLLLPFFLPVGPALRLASQRRGRIEQEIGAQLKSHRLLARQFECTRTDFWVRLTIGLMICN